MRIARYVPVVVLSSIFVVLVLMLFAWRFEEDRNANVASRVSLSGQDVSGHSAAELRSVIEELSRYYAGAKILVGNDDRRFETNGPTVGLKVDIPATERAVLDTRKRGSVANRLGAWWSSFFEPTEAVVVISTTEAKLAEVVEKSDPGPRTPPIEPSINGSSGHMTAVEGKDGHGLNPRHVERAIQKGIQGDDTFKKEQQVNSPEIRAVVSPGVLEPRITIEQARKLASDIERATANAITLRAEQTEHSLTPEQIRPLITTFASGSTLDFKLDSAKTLDLVERLFEKVGTKPIAPKWDVQNDTPVLVEGKNGTQCCDKSAVGVISNAVHARLQATGARDVLVLPMESVPPSIDGTSVDDLKIKEKIATFTTSYTAGQPRVTNIHLISDLVRGQVIAPGKTFSVNNFVGRRTTEKGFVVDHVIEDGKFAESVGGGISQFATTLFNAAFFAGLDFGEYQAHSIYISRYPYGREATISFPHPDLQIRNTSPHGILIWPTYTDTSITVDLYSTHNVDSTQSGQRTEPSGKCTKVITERTRQFVDGTTKKDSVFAIYQPEEGITCN